MVPGPDYISGCLLRGHPIQPPPSGNCLPSIPTILMYTQTLANTHKNVRSVKNYLSGANTFVRNAGGEIASFDSPLLANLIKGIARLSTHVPSSARPCLHPMSGDALMASLSWDQSVSSLAAPYCWASRHSSGSPIRCQEAGPRLAISSLARM